MRDPLTWLEIRKTPISPAEQERLRGAGYTPSNHPNWATLEWLQARRDEWWQRHSETLRQFVPMGTPMARG